MIEVVLAKIVMPLSLSISLLSITRLATSSFSLKAPEDFNNWSTKVVFPWSTCPNTLTTGCLIAIIPPDINGSDTSLENPDTDFGTDEDTIIVTDTVKQTTEPCERDWIIINETLLEWTEEYPIPEVFYFTNNYTIEPHKSIIVNISLSFEKNKSYYGW